MSAEFSQNIYIYRERLTGVKGSDGSELAANDTASIKAFSLLNQYWYKLGGALGPLLCGLLQ